MTGAKPANVYSEMLQGLSKAWQPVGLEVNPKLKGYDMYKKVFMVAKCEKFEAIPDLAVISTDNASPAAPSPSATKVTPAPSAIAVVSPVSLSLLSKQI